MTRATTGIKVEAAAVTDRGLNERRPLNEDSYLSDVARRVFVVADGVGGADAGEVASKTAVEVIEQAFAHQRDDDDVEDLLEIAIQRANASIFRMARENPSYSMMATTVVALHLDGLRATVGHVGDSRLYRVGADGSIARETEDHSVVEEEVRAGRMTPEQAQHHPSRNVISRALGAEADVEVDLHTFDVEGGTTFVLCTDGVTRHVSDGEIARLVSGSESLQAACDELKRLCFERGAEDNLTAVVVRVGEARGGEARGGGARADGDEEQTIITERAAPDSPASEARGPEAPIHLRRPFDDAGAFAQSSAAEARRAARTDGAREAPRDARPDPARRGGGAGRVLLSLFLLTAASAAAFYAGMVYEQRRQPSLEGASLAAQPAPTPASAPAPSLDDDRARVDAGAQSEAARMSDEMRADPARGGDARFHYLFGRALLLSGRPEEALPHFERARGIIEGDMSSQNARLIVDTRLATVVALLRSNNVDGARRAADDVYKGFGGGAPGAPAAPGPSPAAAQQF